MTIVPYTYPRLQPFYIKPPKIVKKAQTGNKAALVEHWRVAGAGRRMTRVQKKAGKYQPPTGVEAEAEPGSRGRVLRNKLGIQSKREMDWKEAEALDAAHNASLITVTTQTHFTASALCRMHRNWLGDIYEWAGQYRTVDVSKGGFTWPPAVLVPQNMSNFEAGALQENTPCRSGPLPEVARRMAVVHAELLLVHPFREGNGRLARWLADLMALQAGWPNPVYGFVGNGSGRQRAHYLAAVKQGYLLRYDDLTGFFAEALERGLEADV